MIRNILKFNVALCVFILAISYKTFSAPAATREIYEIKVYSMKNNTQVDKMDNYLKTSLLPALHRHGINKVGVFKIIGIDTAVFKKIYVLIPFKSLDQRKRITDEVITDNNYVSSSADFVNAPFDKAPYDRMETIFTEAFPRHPMIEMPVLKSPLGDRVYELRSYESPTEHLYERKVTMFNQGDEVGLFKRLNFNAIFYSSVIAGSKMPNLMYMISFEDMADHDIHWKQFGNDPQWKKISTMPEYENKVSVSHIDSILMHPASYSDF